MPPGMSSEDATIFPQGDPRYQAPPGDPSWKTFDTAGSETGNKPYFATNRVGWDTGPNGDVWTGPDFFGAQDAYGPFRQTVATNRAGGNGFDRLLGKAIPALVMGGAGFGLANGLGMLGGDNFLGNIFNGGAGGTSSMPLDWSAIDAGEAVAPWSTNPSLADLGGNVGGSSGGFGIQDLIKKLMGGGGNPLSGAGDLAQLARSLFGGPNKAVGGLGDILAGIYGNSQAGKFNNLAGPGQAAAMQLQNLTNNPDAITSLPGYDALSKAREMAVSRRMAAQGYNMSGNEKTALADAGGQQFMEFRNTELDRLMRLAAGGVAPQTAATQLQGNSINRVLYGASNVLGS